MKKQIVTLAIVSLSAFAARASVVCNTNVNNDPRVAAVTTVSVAQKNTQLTATMQTYGVFAHFIGAPVSFPVVAAHHGPEVVEYTNSNDTFKLEVVFQPMGGKIFGTLTTINNGQTFSKPVVCKALAEATAAVPAAAELSMPIHHCNPYLTPCPKPCDPRIQQCYRN